MCIVHSLKEYVQCVCVCAYTVYLSAVPLSSLLPVCVLVCTNDLPVSLICVCVVLLCEVLKLCVNSHTHMLWVCVYKCVNMDEKI